MPGGIYSALSGMQVRMQDLDRAAADLANISTPGYKSERAATHTAERTAFLQALESAVDVVGGNVQPDLRPGTMSTTGRELDAAIEGRGFFVIRTAAGDRYTRDGAFVRRSDGALTSRDGNPVVGENGELRLSAGVVSIAQDGTVRTGETVAGRLKIVNFADGELERESGAHFRALANVTLGTSTARVVNGSLEAANVSAVDRMVALTNISRAFEGLQRGISVLANDVDGRAISELARR